METGTLGSITDLLNPLDSVNLDRCKTLKLEAHGPSRWVWASTNHMATISSSVYDHIISSEDSGALWSGWKQIWKLFVIPCVKTFIWKMAHGKLTTGAYLYTLNIGPYVKCYFCDLEEDSIDHSIWRCSKVKHIWDSILAMMNINSPDFQFLSSGSWLTLKTHNRMENFKTKALIASTAWLIWKERCNCIFQNLTPKLGNILTRANAYCEDFFSASGKNHRELLRLNSTSNSIFIYTDASWRNISQCAGLGFIIITNPGKILLAGALGAHHDSPINAELDAICHALSICRERSWFPNRIFTDSPGAAKLAQNPHPCIAWQSTGMIIKLRNILHDFQNICVSTIPRDENLLANELVVFGRINPHLSLFFRGMDRPNWLEEICSCLNLSF
ncbi:uncharacterized protein LOC120266776 [Dioscorea cayenensis subsp. rotundata]|uniref:Uncharacterized protein LOC120266776 n=1 Tax=Dioscorea cayennensis subsp. rotundata TaxID=55577 RepID=A0AB40BU34_DIOCR|nr:uncharacterized protein LOC120266776 [Dioscorea cayenensis subsp. rotundata]